jgi:hypothetical protein
VNSAASSQTRGKRQIEGVGRFFAADVFCEVPVDLSASQLGVFGTYFLDSREIEINQVPRVDEANLPGQAHPAIATLDG